MTGLPWLVIKKLIKEIILWKIRNKPSYYRYYGEKKPLSFFVRLMS